MSGSRVTPEILRRGLLFGLTPERIEFLMKIADVPSYDKIDINRPDSYEFIKPDPEGVWYLKASIKGKWIVKPLSNEEEKAKQLGRKKLKELGCIVE